MTLPDATLVAFCYDERPTLNLMRSLIRDVRRWPNLSVWDQSKDALITRMRSSAATMFLEQGAGDVLLMVDHDIGWEAGDLEHITQVCLDLKGVVGGVFPKRGFSQGVPIRFGQYGEYTIPDDRVVECLAVATGFFAIHRDVLRAMEPETPMTMHQYRAFFQDPWLTREDGKIEHESEDYYFCRRARELGFKVFADLRPQLTHHGSYTFSLADTTFEPPAKGQSTTIQFKDTTRPLVVPEIEGRSGELWIDPDDRFVSAALIRGQSWELEVPEYIAAHAKPEDTIVEVGAHIGYHTVQLAPLVAKYVAVEPMPHTLEILRRNVALRGLEGKVDVWPMAMVGTEDLRKSARMLRTIGNPGASHLLDAEEESLGIAVPTCRLDEVAERIDILKLDAEGAEYSILKGAEQALEHCRLIVSEYCDAQLQRVSGVTGEQYLDLLESLGFDTGVPDRSVLPKAQAYCNIVAMRREPLVT